MEEHFLRRRYDIRNLHNQIHEAIITPRSTTLKKVSKERSTRIPLVTTFNSTLPQIGKILRERWDILNVKPKLKKLFSEPPIIAFRRCKNLREIIGCNTIINNKVLRKKPIIEQLNIAHHATPKEACAAIMSLKLIPSLA